MSYTKRDGAEKAVAEAAYRLVASLSHADNDASLLLVFGNRIVEEAGLLGGPLADMAATFGEQLAKEGVTRLTKKRKNQAGGSDL